MATYGEELAAAVDEHVEELLKPIIAELDALRDRVVALEAAAAKSGVDTLIEQVRTSLEDR